MSTSLSPFCVASSLYSDLHENVRKKTIIDTRKIHNLAYICMKEKSFLCFVFLLLLLLKLFLKIHNLL